MVCGPQSLKLFFLSDNLQNISLPLLSKSLKCVDLKDIGNTPNPEDKRTISLKILI